MTQKKLTFNEKIEMLEALKQVYRTIEGELHYSMVYIEETDSYRSYNESDGSWWKEYKTREDIYRRILEFIEDMV